MMILTKRIESVFEESHPMKSSASNKSAQMNCSVLCENKNQLKKHRTSGLLFGCLKILLLMSRQNCQHCHSIGSCKQFRSTKRLLF